MVEVQTVGHVQMRACPGVRTHAAVSSLQFTDQPRRSHSSSPSNDKIRIQATRSHKPKRSVRMVPNSLFKYAKYATMFDRHAPPSSWPSPWPQSCQRVFYLAPVHLPAVCLNGPIPNSIVSRVDSWPRPRLMFFSLQN